jgi:TPP-dependent pyruvate/acetoin dehydrogenase alpha subunit
MALGMALAEKRIGSGAVVVDFLGDGTLGEGIVYECLNMASLWELPVLFVLEHNHIAQTTPSHMAIAGKIAARFEAFDIPATQLNTSDILEIRPIAAELLEKVRMEASPQALILETARLGTHSKGDDTRSSEELDFLWQERDPIAIHGARLQEEQRNKLNLAVEERIQTAFQGALQEGGAP